MFVARLLPVARSCRRRRECLSDWGVQDSNLRRLKPSDLQSDPFDRSGNPPRSATFLHLVEEAKTRARPPPETAGFRPVFTSSGTNRYPTLTFRDSDALPALQWRGRYLRASGGTRTHNLLITNQLLCQLSYASGGANSRKSSNYKNFRYRRKADDRRLRWAQNERELARILPPKIGRWGWPIPPSHCRPCVADKINADSLGYQSSTG